MRMNTSACFGVALAALTFVLPNTTASAFEKSSGVAAATSEVTKVSGETREERAAREAREPQSEKRVYRRCPKGQDCRGSRKEPAAMMLLFPAG